MRKGVKMTRFLTALILLAGLLSATLPAPATAQPVTVSEVRITGTQRIDPATVLTYANLNVGDSVDSTELNNALRRLYATNLFNDVSVSLDGSTVIIAIDENPIINRIAIEGNDVLEDDILLTILDIKPRRVFTEQLAIKGKETLTEAYRQSGRYAAVIEPKIIELPDKRVDLIFEVNEGPLIKISTIKFIGNEAFSDNALKDVIESREAKWYIFLARDDKYDANRLSLDTQKLRQFYLQNGYADIRITRSSGELLADRSGFVLTFQIEENKPYDVGEISITSEIEGVDIDSLHESVSLETGELYDVRVLEETLSALTNKLGEFGYAFVDVRPDLQLDEKEGLVDIALSVGSAQRNYVEKINIRGNDRTLDSVIRRRFELVEGDSFNQLKLTRSERNVRNLGYFSKVSVDVLPGSESDQSVIDMLVEETTTGSLQLGVGYSTFDKATLTFGISENNFLGTGRGARASLSFSDTSASFRAGITEPHLFDRNLLGSFDVFKYETEYTGVDLERTGVDLGVGFSAADDYRHRFGYLLADNQTSIRSSSATSVSGDEGSSVISEVSYLLVKDTRDSRLNPTRGYTWRFSESYAGLGGDATYAKTIARAQYIHPFYFNSVIVGVDGEVGHIDGLGEKVSRSNRFLLGGRKLRGFSSAGVGPRDIGDNTAVGGNQYYAGSANLVSNIGLDKDLGMRWTIFSDFGSVWGTDYPEGVIGAENDSLRTSAGWGLLWDTAIGPMTFMWAYPIQEEEYDRTKIFQFRFGSSF
jgi:outer membrane protein insertion porin family